MKSNISARILVVAALLACALRVTAAEVEKVLLDDRKADSGFLPIFNGKDLTGWDGNPQLWSVKDGAIVGQTTVEKPTKGNTFLVWTNGSVGDFELRASFKITANNDQGFANSGIQYRSKVLDEKTWVVGGYQADMEAGAKYTGILYDERGVAGGRNIMAERGEKIVWDKDCKKQIAGSLGKSEDIQAAIKKDDWNDYVVIAKGNHLQHFINGKQTVDVTDECEAKRLKTGVLALQLHAGPPMTVQFKNIRIKTLSAGDEASAGDQQKLQGVWEVTGGEVNGAPIASEDVPSIVVTIRESLYEVAKTDGTDRGSFTISPSTQPKQMDIRPDTGGTLFAIYEVGTDTFRVCYAAPEADRPKAFASEADSGRLVINYKRKKKP